MLRRRVYVLVVAIVACTALSAASAGLASASTHPSTLSGQHGVKRAVPFAVKTLYSKRYGDTIVKVEAIGSAAFVASASHRGTSGVTPQQEWGCQFQTTDRIVVGTSTAQARLYSCVNVASCVVVAAIQWLDPGGQYISIATSKPTVGCALTTGASATASKKCVKGSNYNNYRGQGTFTIYSIFGDKVGPFNDHTNGGAYKILC